MTDREAWVREHVEDYCRALGYEETPDIAFLEDDAPILPFRVRDAEVVGKKIVELPRLQFRVSPSAIEGMPEREMRYQLAMALVRHSPAEKKWMEKSLHVAMVPTTLTVVIVALLTIALGWIWLLASLALLVVIPLSFMVALIRQEMRVWKLHVATIELTGDAATGLSILTRCRRRGLVSGLAAMLPWSRQQIVQKVEAEAKRLEYRTKDAELNPLPFR